MKLQQSPRGMVFVIATTLFVASCAVPIVPSAGNLSDYEFQSHMKMVKEIIVKDANATLPDNRLGPEPDSLPLLWPQPDQSGSRAFMIVPRTQLSSGQNLFNFNGQSYFGSGFAVFGLQLDASKNSETLDVTSQMQADLIAPDIVNAPSARSGNPRFSLYPLTASVPGGAPRLVVISQAINGLNVPLSANNGPGFDIYDMPSESFLLGSSGGAGGPGPRATGQNFNDPAWRNAAFPPPPPPSLQALRVFPLPDGSALKILFRDTTTVPASNQPLFLVDYTLPGTTPIGVLGGVPTSFSTNFLGSVADMPFDGSQAFDPVHNDSYVLGAVDSSGQNAYVSETWATGSGASPLPVSPGQGPQSKYPVVRVLKDGTMLALRDGLWTIVPRDSSNGIPVAESDGKVFKTGSFQFLYEYDEPASGTHMMMFSQAFTSPHLGNGNDLVLRAWSISRDAFLALEQAP